MDPGIGSQKGLTEAVAAVPAAEEAVVAVADAALVVEPGVTLPPPATMVTPPEEAEVKLKLVAVAARPDVREFVAISESSLERLYNALAH